VERICLSIALLKTNRFSASTALAAFGSYMPRCTHSNANQKGCLFHWLHPFLKPKNGLASKEIDAEIDARNREF